MLGSSKLSFSANKSVSLNAVRPAQVLTVVNAQQKLKLQVRNRIEVTFTGGVRVLKLSR